MGNKKKGFTLPELLITMGILGVMAALLIPHVVKNIEKNKSGAILGKAVAQIELGCQNMIQKANESMEGGSYIQTLGLIRVNDLYPDTKSYALVISPLTFSNYIMPYWGVKKITTNDGQNIKITDYYGDELSSGTGNWLFDLILDLFKNTYRYEFNKFPANVYIPTDIKNYINKNNTLYNIWV